MTGQSPSAGPRTSDFIGRHFPDPPDSDISIHIQSNVPHRRRTGSRWADKAMPKASRSGVVRNGRKSRWLGAPGATKRPLNRAMAILLVTLAVLATSQIYGPARASAVQPAGCSPVLLAQEAQVAAGEINSSAATTLAVNSAEYQALISEMAAETTATPESTYADWGYSNDSCVPVIQTFSVVFQLESAGGSASLTLTENPSINAVVGAQLSQSPSSASLHAASGEWNGYEVPVTGLTFGEWTNPRAADTPSGQCETAVCEFVIWVGQTATQGGSTGIAQTGSAVTVHCVLVKSVWSCPDVDFAWYEYYPAALVDCLAVSPGNVMVGEVSYSASKFPVSVEDENTSQGCSADNSISGMGSPQYSQWMGEDPIVDGSNPPIPDFAPWSFDDIFVQFDYNLLNESPIEFQQNYPTVQVGPLTYESGPCITITSCFTEEYN